MHTQHVRTHEPYASVLLLCALHKKSVVEPVTAAERASVCTLGVPLTPTLLAAAPENVGILLLGDSGERILLKQLCLEWAGGQPVQRFDIQLANISGSTCNRYAVSSSGSNLTPCPMCSMAFADFQRLPFHFMAPVSSLIHKSHRASAGHLSYEHQHEPFHEVQTGAFGHRVADGYCPSRVREAWEQEDPNCCTCALPTLRVTREAIWSLSRQPLAFNFHEERLGLADERIKQVIIDDNLQASLQSALLLRSSRINSQQTPTLQSAARARFLLALAGQSDQHKVTKLMRMHHAAPT